MPVDLKDFRIQQQNLPKIYHFMKILCVKIASASQVYGPILEKLLGAYLGS